jgi:Domain of unknown function (DUF4397)
MNRYGSLALLLCAAAIVACDKNGRQDITAPASGANVKFFNFGVNAPGVNFYANTQKLTAISSTSCQPPNDTTAVCRSTGSESTTGTAYAAAGSGALYNEIAPGQVTLSGKIAAATDKDLAIANVSTSLADGKFYSYFVSGVYDAAAKKVDAFVVEDPIPEITDYSQTYVRFVNAISNAQPMTLYAKSTVTAAEGAVGATVSYAAAGTFVTLPAGVYDLSTRTAGSSTNVITRTGVSFVGGHAYTVTSRGAIGNTGTTAPGLDNTANR